MGTYLLLGKINNENYIFEENYNILKFGSVRKKILLMQL